MTPWDEPVDDVPPTGPAPVPGIVGAAPLQGLVDYYGYHASAGGWLFAGWLVGEDEAFAAAPDTLLHGVAWFDDEQSAGPLTTLYFGRAEAQRRAAGFVFFMPADFSHGSTMHHLVIDAGGVERRLQLAQAVQLPFSKLVAFLHEIIQVSEPGPSRDEMARLIGQPVGDQTKDCIEFYGYQPLAEGWFISGWLSEGWPQSQRAAAGFAAFAEGDLCGDMMISLYERQDLPDGACGFVLFIRGNAAAALGPLRAVGWRVEGRRIVVGPIANVQRFTGAELAAHGRDSLVLASPGRQRDRLLNLLARRRYQGEDTLAALTPDIHAYIDEAIACGSGLLLIGWSMTRPGEAFEARIRSGARSSALHLRDSVRTERHDVAVEFGKQGYDTAQCGFVAFLPEALEADEPVYLEIKTARGEIGYRPVPLSVRAGIAAIKHILGAVRMSAAQMQHGFDTALGPAVAALNAARLAAPGKSEIVQYGPSPAAPLASVIVPLYGRLDFMEYQLALFSEHAAAAATEFIYVLDDPSQQREAARLFTTVYERFLVPFTVVLPDRNLGFAPASNLGLAQAKGRYVAFLNSDVFPGTLDWLEQLTARLEEDPSLGAIGPLLLFEDGTVQHKGMVFERLPEFGDWFFCQHPDKGRRVTQTGRVERSLAITGACMVMRAGLARQLRGFDEGFVIGDFEDADLCLRIAALGLGCGVDTEVKMFHLERKSQDGPGYNWRMNATAYNAWRHDRRWRQAIIAAQEIGSGQ